MFTNREGWSPESLVQTEERVAHRRRHGMLLSVERRSRRHRRSSKTWRELKRRMRWVWFYALALFLVTTATLCALRGE